MKKKKKSQAEHFQAAKHQKEITDNVWNANYDGNNNENGPKAVLTVLWKASGPKQTGLLLCSGVLGRRSVPGISVIPSAEIRNEEPQGSPQDKVPPRPVLFFYANKLDLFQGRTPGFPTFSTSVPGRPPPQLCAVQTVWIVSFWNSGLATFVPSNFQIFWP